MDRDIWQCPVVLLAGVRGVGMQDDGRTYGHPVVLRTTVTFDDHDQGVIASVSSPDRVEWAALVEAAAEKGIILKPGASEAAIIRALVHAGADALRERALERGYAASRLMARCTRRR